MMRMRSEMMVSVFPMIIGLVLAWGAFLTAVINFLIIAWVLFLMVQLVNRLMQREAAKTPPLTKEEVLLTEIRDLLRAGK